MLIKNSKNSNISNSNKSLKSSVFNENKVKNTSNSYQNTSFKTENLSKSLTFNNSKTPVTPNVIEVSCINQNYINSELDIDNVVAKLVDKVEEGLKISGEILHK